MQRLADDLVERDLRVLVERLPRLRRRARSGCSFAIPSWSASALTAGPKPWSRSTTGSSSNERSRSERIVSRCFSSAEASIAFGLLGAAAVDRRDHRVEHQRDPRHRLHRPVVEEEREPAALVLLGRDQLIGEPRVLGRQRLELLLDPLVLLPFCDEQRRGESPRGGDRQDQPDEREPLRADSQSDDADNRARDDERDENGGSSR